MLIRLRYIVLLMTIALSLITCQKEFSFEGGALKQSVGSLRADNNGECLAKNVFGNFAISSPLTTDNSLSVEVNVTEAGNYKIFTDTINGYYFSESGIFTNTGIQTVILKGSGTPLVAGNDIFEVRYNNSVCNVPITVSSTAPVNAEFWLQGAGGNCLGANVNGTYTTNVALNSNNTVVINVDVTKPGNYSISTTATNGIMFSASGNFATNGAQTISLSGIGTPVSTGSTVISISAGTSTCRFTINVTAPSTFDYFPRTTNSNWTYEIDDSPNDSARFFVVPPRLTVQGNSYNIIMVVRGTSTDSSGYYRKTGSQYYRYMNLGDFIGFDSALWGEYKFIDDAAPSGTNWKSPTYNGMVTIGGLPPEPMTIRFSTTVFAKDITMNLMTSTGTANYTNVIAIEEKYERLIAGSWVDITGQVGYFKKYYARDIGLIKYEAFNNAGTINAIAELRRYQVY